MRSEADRRAAERSLVQNEVSPASVIIRTIGDAAGPEALLGELASEAATDGGQGVLILGDAGMAISVEDCPPGSPQVIDPGALAMKVAEAVVDLGLRHSRQAYRIRRWILDLPDRDRVRLPEPVAQEVRPAPPPRAYRIKVVVPISGMTESDVGLRIGARAGLLHATTRVDYRASPTARTRGTASTTHSCSTCSARRRSSRPTRRATTPCWSTRPPTRGSPAVRPHLRALALGPGEACWTLASVIGEHFTILSMERKWEFFFIKGPKTLRDCSLGSRP